MGTNSSKGLKNIRVRRRSQNTNLFTAGKGMKDNDDDD